MWEGGWLPLVSLVGSNYLALRDAQDFLGSVGDRCAAINGTSFPRVALAPSHLFP